LVETFLVQNVNGCLAWQVRAYCNGSLQFQLTDFYVPPPGKCSFLRYNRRVKLNGFRNKIYFPAKSYQCCSEFSLSTSTKSLSAIQLSLRNFVLKILIFSVENWYKIREKLKTHVISNSIRQNYNTALIFAQFLCSFKGSPHVCSTTPSLKHKNVFWILRFGRKNSRNYHFSFILYIKTLFLGVSFKKSLTTQQPLLLHQPTSHQQRFFVSRLDPQIHHRPIEHGGQEIVPNAFDLVERRVGGVQLLGQSEDRTHRINANYLAIWAALFDLAADAGDGSARSGSHHHHVDFFCANFAMIYDKNMKKNLKNSLF